jgi:hypothetical protein
MKLNEAKQIIVSLGKTGKMPCPSYNTPATLCVTGSRLRKIKGSTCNGCYAMKGNYVRPNVRKWLEKRFNAFDHPRFTEAMFYMINHYSKKSGYFRWFDSGDLANIHMLEKIVLVCQNTPTIKHWLPTREVKIVKDYLKIYEKFPDNLLVRVSAPMIDGKPLKFRWQEGILYKWTSTVHHKQKAIGHDCPSRFQENKCNSCRACWDRNIKNVSYHKH